MMFPKPSFSLLWARLIKATRGWHDPWLPRLCVCSATETPDTSVATSQPKSILVILGGFNFSHTGPDVKVIDSVLFLRAVGKGGKFWLIFPVRCLPNPYICSFHEVHLKKSATLEFCTSFLPGVYYLKRKVLSSNFVYDSSCPSTLGSLVSLDVLKIPLNFCYKLRQGKGERDRVQIICFKASCFISDSLLFLWFLMAFLEPH